MSLEDIQKSIDRIELCQFIGEQLILMWKSGRLDEQYRKYMKHDEIALAAHFIERLEKLGYEIVKVRLDQ